MTSTRQVESDVTTEGTNNHTKATMALRYSASFLASGLRRQMATQSRAMSQMAFTFAAPNGVHYEGASVKQVRLMAVFLANC